jgi:hypothetical protein
MISHIQFGAFLVIGGLMFTVITSYNGASIADQPTLTGKLWLLLEKCWPVVFIIIGVYIIEAI